MMKVVLAYFIYDENESDIKHIKEIATCTYLQCHNFPEQRVFTSTRVKFIHHHRNLWIKNAFQREVFF